MSEQDPLEHEDSYLHRPGAPDEGYEEEPVHPWAAWLYDLGSWLGSFPTVLVVLYVTAILAGLAWTAYRMP